MIRGPRLIAVGVTIIALGVTGTAVAKHAKPAVLKYRAYVTSNSDAGGCYSKVALYVGLQAQMPKRVTAAKLKKVAETNRPKSASVVVDSKRYPLLPDPGSSAYGNGQVGWSFRPAALSRDTALKLVGKQATVSYLIGSKAHSATTHVSDGRCKSLI